MSYTQLLREKITNWHRMKKPVYLLFAFLVLAFASCNKTEKFDSAELSDYLQLAVGKYITYRLDSLKYINFGQKDTFIHYQAKDVVEAEITDNLGRPAWRVVRYLRDTNSTKESDWKPTGTFMAVLTRNSYEWVEYNMRFEKLRLPIKDGYNWKGNAYIDTYSSFSDFQFLDDWDYMYENVDQPFTVFGGVQVPNTITVNQADETIETAGYRERNYGVEVYGKGIGLVFKDFIHWEYQPPNGGNPGYYNGYGIKLRMTGHN